ncbi:MAG TPA: LamB/YcsF family protein [Kofleriaceae bacterium]|nr:LamB/YcsF family protein [Kofleriaceae bacterium]
MHLNLDAGELASESEELWRLADIVCVACGGHAGDATSMTRVVRCCADAGPRLGAHPSYPDREGFGRRTLELAPASAAAIVAEQCTALASIAQTYGRAVEYVKPHGALYHDAARSEELADAVVRGATAALGRTITVIGPAVGALRVAAIASGLRYAREGFADRALRADGMLVPRGEPGAVLEDLAAIRAQVRALVPKVDTICVHGDTPNAIAIARAVREVLRG